uniref:Cytochrome c oxidase subunit III n=2 Tax=Candidatus Bipolaricaulota TaxID=67810 RepID=H5SFG2_9BACT|nr:cytochrome c oxidase subunit III [uncultured Acetothermia bacterium]BAL60034.1 cytochrome c oxidase subunit III [Candidatus Acetothermum autotrophicum]
MIAKHNLTNGHRDLMTPGRVGLWLFLAVATMVFAALISAYIVRMGSSDWHSLPKPGLLWVNTAILLLSSAAFHWALVADRQGHIRSVRLGVVAGAVLSALFFVGQVWAWLVLQKLGYFLSANPSSSFFYLLTAVHGAHLLGGLIVAAWTVRTRERLQLFVTYWHFLTAVWVVLFALIVLT